MAGNVTHLLLVALLGWSPFCKRHIHVGMLPPNDPNGRWVVALHTQGSVWKRHRARFRKLAITPNGEAWAGVLLQCLAKPDLAGINLDPEAGALHAWIETDEAKDRWLGLLCRAVDDNAWLEQCLAGVDRAKIDY
jgi:hypothetical protein